MKHETPHWPWSILLNCRTVQNCSCHPQSVLLAICTFDSWCILHLLRNGKSATHPPPPMTSHALIIIITITTTIITIIIILIYIK